MDRYYLNSSMTSFTRDGRHIVYFPESSVIMQVNGSGADLLHRLKKEGVKPDFRNLQFLDGLSDLGLVSRSVPSAGEAALSSQYKSMSAGYDFRTLTLFLTERCNLRCLYCYAHGGTGERTMDSETARAALEFMAGHCAAKALDLHVAFHGAGEPTSAGEILPECVELAKKMAAERGLKVFFSIGTNGIMEEKYRQMIVSQDFDISLSLDGPEKIHNRLRPMPGGNSFGEAMKTAGLCTENGLPFSVRTTVTDINCAALPELVSFLFENTSCENIQMEPVYMQGRAAASALRPPAMEEFVSSYFRCMEISEALERNIIYSGISYPSPRGTFCQACGQSLCVRPDGWLTGCYESAHMEPGSDPFSLGRINPDTLSVDIYAPAYDTAVSSSMPEEECGRCFAFSHCGGDCPSKMTGTEKGGGYRCQLNRKILEEHLFLHLEESGERCIKFN